MVRSSKNNTSIDFHLPYGSQRSLLNSCLNNSRVVVVLASQIAEIVDVAVDAAGPAQVAVAVVLAALCASCVVAVLGMSSVGFVP